jgi:aldehyde:ferredoxin oxidoreductase
MTMAGTILRVDLTRGSIEKEPTSKYVDDYIGGAAIGTKIFCDEVPPVTRALDPENMLMFNTGPLTGTLLGNKATIGAKTAERANHPYTFVGMGGQIASEIKFAGYDHIVIRGRSARPVYIYINNDTVEIRDASHLWGLDTHETQYKLRQELEDQDVQIACIGPAGENLVVYALILHDLDNTASRKVGSVMGSKNLKAVAVRGTKGLKIADPKLFLELFDEFYQDITTGRGSTFARQQHQEGISRQIAEGYQFAYGTELPKEIPPSPMMDFLKKFMVRPSGCAFCSFQCHQMFSVPGVGNGATTCVNYLGLLFQRMYDAHDFDLWWERTILANQYGIDSLSVEMIGSWLMELYRRGLITEADTDGIPMVRRSREAIIAVIEKIAKKEGFGKLFTDGIAPAAKKIGKDSLVYADQYDNATPYAWADYAPDLGAAAQWRTGEVERVPGFGDAYGNIPVFAEILGISFEEARDLIDSYCSDASERITGDRDVWKTPRYSKNTSRITIEKEDEILLSDVTGVCEARSSYLEHYGLRFGIDHFARWLRAATGINYTPERLREMGRKLRLLVDSYNVLCKRAIGEEPAVGMPFESLTVLPTAGRPKDPRELKKVQEDYCATRGYDPATGVPTRVALEELGLEDIADRLESTAAGSAAPHAGKAVRKTKRHR